MALNMLFPTTIFMIVCIKFIDSANFMMKDQFKSGHIEFYTSLERQRGWENTFIISSTSQINQYLFLNTQDMKIRKYVGNNLDSLDWELTSDVKGRQAKLKFKSKGTKQQSNFMVHIHLSYLIIAQFQQNYKFYYKHMELHPSQSSLQPKNYQDYQNELIHQKSTNYFIFFRGFQTLDFTFQNQHIFVKTAFQKEDKPIIKYYTSKINKIYITIINFNLPNYGKKQFVKLKFIFIQLSQNLQFLLFQTFKISINKCKGQNISKQNSYQCWDIKNQLQLSKFSNFKSKQINNQYQRRLLPPACGGSCPCTMPNATSCTENLLPDTTCACWASNCDKGTAPYLGLCEYCPLGCTGCQTKKVISNNTDAISCSQCATGFFSSMDSNSIKSCVCPGGKFADGTVHSPVCSSCVAPCSTCTSLTACTSCPSGSYLQGSTCLACMPVCATCVDGTTCSTCPSSNLTLTGTVCVCNSPLFFDSVTKSCLSCAILQPNCATCNYSTTYDPANPSTVICYVANWGYYVDGGVAIHCIAYCIDCSSAPTLMCTTCSTNFTFDPVSKTCVCSSTTYYTNATNGCITCAEIISNCQTCNLYIIPTQTDCSSCSIGYYSTAITYPTSSCSQCPSLCTSCTASNVCISCINNLTVLNDGSCGCNATDSLLIDPQINQCFVCYLQCISCNLSIVNATCSCNNTAGFWELNLNCIACSTLITNCTTCILNSTSSTNVSCLNCTYGSYVQNGICLPSICNDSKITSGEFCDDGNLIDGDGCSSICAIQTGFACVYEPSICYPLTSFTITPITIQPSKINCNELKIGFKFDPFYNSYSSTNFQNLLGTINNTKLIYKSWQYQNSIATYTFDYKEPLLGQIVTIRFLPSLSTVIELSTVTFMDVSITMQSTNNIPLIFYQDSVCKSKKSVQAWADAIQYTSYATLLLSALPCKIVGLELFGVLQLAHINVGNIDNVNMMLQPMTGFKGVHGLTANIGKQSKSRLLLATTPSRVWQIGYQSNFLRNCNVMLLLVIIVLLTSFTLYSIAFCLKRCANKLYKFSKRMVKEVFLTLVLFNCFNFSYSAGIHFSYASKQDTLYNAGTIAAILAIVLPIVMAIILMFTQDQGFGEYKQKFKAGAVEKFYFVATIIYRSGIGFYISTANQNSLSTLIVIGFSIAFLLYNLINLPYSKAYHNYRANVCHITQFICLFVSLYYRSMMSSTPVTQVAEIFSPAYLMYSCIFISLLVSLAVLGYEIYLYILECKSSSKNRPKKLSQSSHLATTTVDQIQQKKQEQSLEYPHQHQ